VAYLTVHPRLVGRTLEGDAEDALAEEALASILDSPVYPRVNPKQIGAWVKLYATHLRNYRARGDTPWSFERFRDYKIKERKAKNDRKRFGKLAPLAAAASIAVPVLGVGISTAAAGAGVVAAKTDKGKEVLAKGAQLVGGVLQVIPGVGTAVGAGLIAAGQLAQAKLSVDSLSAKADEAAALAEAEAQLEQEGPDAEDSSTTTMLVAGAAAFVIGSALFGGRRRR